MQRETVTGWTRSAALAAIANLVSVAFAAWIFSGFTIEIAWLVAAVVLFTVLTVVLRRAVTAVAGRLMRAYALVGGLVLTAAALYVTDLLTPDRGFLIEGAGTWAGVTVIVWAAGNAYGEIDHQAPPEVPPVSR
jgi:drug/metabolite transporter superfamily protein YnfA